ncbi:MAG: hypothetical protein ABI678_09240 [Kofleriaceae bacterium]
MQAVLDGVEHVALDAIDLDLAEPALRAGGEVIDDPRGVGRQVALDRRVEARARVAGVLDDAEDLDLRVVVDLVIERRAILEGMALVTAGSSGRPKISTATFARSPSSIL